LQKDLDLKYQDQTLAVYPAPLAPHPYPYPAPMDREAGIAAYQAMITAEAYQAKSAAGARDHLHLYQNDYEAPVLQVSIAEVEDCPGAVKKYRLVAVDGGDLPRWTAGAHLDIVVAPEYLRQYSMCGDPADRSCYESAVLQEPAGRGGAQLMHRIFEPGRRVFVSKPINHFELDPSAKMSLLFGGGIGVTPMLAFAHDLHRKGGAFRLMYSASQKSKAAFDGAFDGLAWADRVSRHYSDKGTRLDIARAVPSFEAGMHIYVCGPDAYMSAILEHARSIGYPEVALHAEFFTLPELPERENFPFEIERANGQKISVTSAQSASDALIAAGVPVDVKCADGLCGVCKCTLVSGAVEHRDFVLSAAQRETTMILCQSRAAKAGGVLKLDI
jgi:ferredoxin-NADP reductase